MFPDIRNVRLLVNLKPPMAPEPPLLSQLSAFPSPARLLEQCARRWRARPHTPSRPPTPLFAVMRRGDHAAILGPPPIDGLTRALYPPVKPQHAVAVPLRACHGTVAPDLAPTTMVFGRIELHQSTQQLFQPPFDPFFFAARKTEGSSGVGTLRPRPSAAPKTYGRWNGSWHVTEP